MAVANFEFDPFNAMGRNIHNTEKVLYNCAGYALETFNWYRPGDTPTVCEYRTSRQMRKRLRKAVQYMLNDFPDLRVVQTFDELQSDEYGICYRIGHQDFHFIKRGDNGVFYSKQGGCEEIEKMTKEQVLERKWYSWVVCYDSPIIKLAKKKRK